MRDYYLILALVFFFSSGSHAQSGKPSVLNASGFSAIKGYYSFDWSVGESTSITTLISGNSMVTQGVLQYHSGTVVEKNFAMNWFPNEVRLFPNPVKDLLEIDFKHLAPGVIHLELLSNSGQFLWRKEVLYNGVSHIEKLNMSGFIAGQYILYIYQNQIPDNNNLKNFYKAGSFNVLKIQ